MDKLRENNLDKYIIKKISKKIPSLFICVGMQILFTKSYELGEHNGLNIFEGEVNKIEETDASGRKVRNVPAIGWNRIEYKNKCKSFKNIAEELYKRSVVPFYIIILAMIGSCLALKSDREAGLTHLKIILFITGVFLIILSQILSQYIGNLDIKNLFTIFLPFLFSIIFYIFLQLRLKH